MKPLKLLVTVAIVFTLTACTRRPIQEAVLTGADAFQTVPVSSLQAGLQAGIYDSKEGIEIAAMQHGKITFLDPTTFAEKRSVPENGNPAVRFDLISLRADGKLNLMRSGGGYSDIGVYEMDGKELWKFQPSEKLHPNKMIAEDLDRDGTKEFYVADSTGVYRLDPAGKVVWHATVRGMNDYLFSLPAEGTRPACVVTECGMWDCNGKELQRGIKRPSAHYLHGVKWGNAYHFVSGQNSGEGGHFFVFDLTGKTVFQGANDGWGAVEFFTVRFKPGELPSLVVHGRNQSTLTQIQMSIFGPDGTLVYRDVRQGENYLVVPNEAKGQDTLLLNSEKGIRKFMKR